MDTITYTLKLDDLEATVFYNYTPPQRGRLSGPPEDCYPPEDAEVELTDLHIDGVILSPVKLAAILDQLQNDDDLRTAICEQESDKAEEAHAEWQAELRRMEE